MINQIASTLSSFFFTIAFKSITCIVCDHGLFSGDWKNCVGKPALHSFNEKGAEENFVAPVCSSINSFGECDTTQVQRCPEYHTPQDPVTFNEATVLNENDDAHTKNTMSETEVKMM